jgi:hypothetical protein
MQTKEIKMTSIQVTFTDAQEDVVGTMDFKEGMATMIGLDVVEDICQRLRVTVNNMGEPLNFRIEYISEDL